MYGLSGAPERSGFVGEFKESSSLVYVFQSEQIWVRSDLASTEMDNEASDASSPQQYWLIPERLPGSVLKVSSELLLSFRIIDGVKTHCC